MKDYQELAPDAETFQRVWKRVMPDESLSQIVVHPPQQGKGSRPGKSPAPQPAPVPEPAGDEELLRQLLELLDEGAAGIREIMRRQPGTWPLRDSFRKSANQVRSAWFLLTGRRWNVGRQGTGSRESFGQLLRRQYLWEISFAQRCRETEKAVQAGDIQEIFPGLETESRRRRMMIRNLLAGT